MSNLSYLWTGWNPEMILLIAVISETAAVVLYQIGLSE